MTCQDTCFSFHRRTCSQLILIVDTQQVQSRQLSISLYMLYQYNVTMMVLMRLCFLQIQRYASCCRLRACSRMNPMQPQLVIPDARALSHIDNNTKCPHSLTCVQWLVRTFAWASSSNLLTMDLDRWQTASAVQKALDIVVQASSEERHNDGTHDVVFLSNPTVMLLLSFQSRLTYESHATSTHDSRCQSVKPYW